MTSVIGHSFYDGSIYGAWRSIILSNGCLRREIFPFDTSQNGGSSQNIVFTFHFLDSFTLRRKLLVLRRDQTSSVLAFLHKVEPWMLQGLWGGQALLWVFEDEFLAEVFSAVWDLLPLRDSAHVKLALLVFLKNLFIGAFEDGLARQNTIKNNSSAEHIRQAVASFILEDLWCHISWRSAL